MKSHEFANIFPLMDGKEFKKLKKDIEENGLLDSIVLFEGKILDGRNRYNACEELGIEVKTREYRGKDALQYIMSTNLRRRHLTDSQKAVVGRRYKVYYAKIYPQGGDRRSKEFQGGTGSTLKDEEKKVRDKAGELVGISGRYIDIADEVIEAKPEMEEKIMKGEVKLKTAYRDIKLEKQKKEIQKLKEVTGEYDIIVIDPPWQYEGEYDPDSRRGTCPYPTMATPKIRNIKLPAAENCVLWLWTTHKFIWDAKNIMDEWGFEYKAIVVWNKEKLGIGKTLRMQCEFCLVGFKGKPYWNLTNQRDIIEESRTTHSTKPEIFYKLVEETCAGRKLDYFATKKREGWDVYGTIKEEGENEKSKMS